MLKQGTIINNRYKVEDAIGKGGTSSVYLVRDIRIGKRWAMKELKREDKMSIILARREVDMLKSIDYKLFPRITDAFVSSKCLYIISDYIEGISLDKIVKNKIIPKSRAVKWMNDIALAISYLHGLSPPVLYLDLKPENILVMPNEEIRLIDFGIAGRITGEHVPLGTPGFAAPEQYEKNGEKLSVRTDIFAFGMMYYVLREGEYPGTKISITYKNIKDSSTLSRREKSFILKCIQMNPKDRFECMDRVAYQINSINKSFYNPGRIINYVATLIAIIIITIITILSIHNRSNKELAVGQMLTNVAMYMEEGEYTIEGLKMITAYIDGGFLASDVSIKFTYEVAMNYFGVQRDYDKAYKYFSKIDSEVYEDVPYLIKLCKAQMEFDFDREEVLECLGYLYRNTLYKKDSGVKYKELIYISQWYENYDYSEIEGIKKAITVLEEARTQLTKAKGLEDEEYEYLINLYDKQIENLYIKAKYISTRKEEGMYDT